VSESLLNTSQSNFIDFMQLVQYPDYDSYTVGHSVRVALLLVLVGHRLGMEQDFLTELGTVGLLHDVGKARIPEEILFKRDRLDEEERRIIEGHTILGAQILLENKDASPLAVAAAWGHHLRHDGGGYPATPSWNHRDRVTSLLQICDVYEALTAVRPYKLALTPRRAFEIMLRDEGAYDPIMLAAFIRAMGFYPPGSPVRLTDGRRAVVLAAGADIERPQVRITHTAEGLPIEADHALVLDLGEPGWEKIEVSTLLLEETHA
jgi:putative nucleotidyltransferase with HDIG domain